MKTIKIFLASSAELKGDRDQFEISISRKNKDAPQKGFIFETIRWEDFMDAMSSTRLQDEYNKAIAGCDIFVALFHTKAGKYTEEEFDKAFGKFQETRRPFIFTYFKEGPQEIKKDETLLAFQKKLSDLGHFYTIYESTEALLYHFSNQLEKLQNNLFTKVDSPGPQLVQYAKNIYNIGKIKNASFD